MDFEHQQALYKQEKFNELTNTNEGKRFLKLKSFHRPQYLENFLEKNGISFKELKKSTVAGLEHINSIDWICLAANKEDNKFYLTIVNPSDEKKKHKIIFRLYLHLLY